VSDITNLDPADIESIDVLKDKSATDLYGEKGKNGVILITSKNPGNPIVIVDGREYDSIEDADVEPDEIESISVLKDKSATILYGEKGKNGVILVTTKGSKEIQKGELPIVLNGRMTELTLNETDRDLLKTANKIEPEQAVKKYGERGKNGAIELKISKDFEDNHRSTGELSNENSVIRTPQVLRKFIASNIKYPAKAQENDTEGKVSFNFRVDKNGNIFDISKPGPSGLALDEITIIGYKSNKSGRYKKKVSTRILANEIKRVLELTPKLDIPEFNGKTINITVDFTLQYP
jgi:TonB-dependent SusC/RagA subfamily outer membrane receptor